MRDDIEFNIQFCEEVEKHPCLYDYTPADYCNRSAQDQAWLIISEKMKATVAECRDRWKNVRGRYSKYKKQVKLPSGAGAKKIKEYYLASHLQFLDYFLKSRESKGNIKPTEEVSRDYTRDSENDNEHNENMDEDVDETQVSREDTNQLSSHSTNATSPTPTAPLPSPNLERQIEKGPRKRARSSPSRSSFIDLNSSASKYFEAKKQILDHRPQSTPASKPDPDEAFWQSILPDMKLMDNMQKRQFKMGVLRLADDILNPMIETPRSFVMTDQLRGYTARPLSRDTSTSAATSYSFSCQSSRDHFENESRSAVATPNPTLNQEEEDTNYHIPNYLDFFPKD